MALSELWEGAALAAIRIAGKPAPTLTKGPCLARSFILAGWRTGDHDR
jgi:hypothetical protein